MTMHKSSKPTSPSISPLFQKMIRNAFRMDALEERILLSADPAGGLVQTVVRSAPALDDEGLSTRPSGCASAGDVSLREGQIPLSTAIDDAFFSVDGLAFDQVLTQTRSDFMESALALSEAD
jgi:hypothetical protein